MDATEQVVQRLRELADMFESEGIEVVNYRIDTSYADELPGVSFVEAGTMIKVSWLNFNRGPAARNERGSTTQEDDPAV